MPYLHALLINQNFVARRRPRRRRHGRALVVGHDVEERRQGVQRAGRHHDDVYAVLRGARRRRAVERRRRQREFFLSRPRLRVLGSDGRGGASTAAAAVRWSRGVASVPWGRRAARGGRLLWPGTYSFECSALFRRRRVETRGALRENTYTQPPSQGVATPESPWVSSCEAKRDGQCGKFIRKLSKC